MVEIVPTWNRRSHVIDLRRPSRSGKTAIATGLARGTKAVHLRIDSIEQALRSSNVVVSGPEGYLVANAIAEDNLRLGRTVIADSVNPVEVTRAAWRKVAQRAGKRCIEIEIVCSDQAEHRRRVESRIADIVGHELPTWQQVCDREYEPWLTNIAIDTAGQPIEAMRGSESVRRNSSGGVEGLLPCTPERIPLNPTFESRQPICSRPSGHHDRLGWSAGSGR